MYVLRITLLSTYSCLTQEVQFRGEVQPCRHARHGIVVWTDLFHMSYYDLNRLLVCCCCSICAFNQDWPRIASLKLSLLHCYSARNINYYGGIDRSRNNQSHSSSEHQSSRQQQRSYESVTECTEIRWADTVALHCNDMHSIVLWRSLESFVLK